MHRPDLWPLLSRILNADIITMALRMAYESAESGDDTIWRHALGDDNGDMAAIYARASDDATAMGHAFLQWFEKDTRVARCDYATLSAMDARIASLDFSGRGQIGEGAIKCLTIDPVSGASYLGTIAGDIAGNPSWRNIDDEMAEAHFLQIMGEIGATRIGSITMRDKKLAARLFPELLSV
jgi:hypothetical protein